jgi:hypothetical protein
MSDMVDQEFGDESVLGVLPENPSHVQGKLESSVVFKDGVAKTEQTLKEETKTIETKLYKQSPSYLNVRFSTTINLGNYQTAKVEKGIFVPLGAELDPELVKKFQATDSWASKLLNELIEKDVKPIRQHVRERNG